MVDEDGNDVKERLPDFRDNDNPAIVLTLCKKAISLCIVYELYDDAGSWKRILRAQHRALTGDCKDFLGELISDVRDWKNNGKAKHKKICQKLCSEAMGDDAYNDQKDAMRAGLTYAGHDHHDMVKKLWKINESLEYMADDAKKFTPRKLCREIITATLKTKAAEKYTYFGGEEMDNKNEVLKMVKRIGKGIDREWANDFRRNNKQNNSDHKRTGNGGGNSGKKPNIC